MSDVPDSPRNLQRRLDTTGLELPLPSWLLEKNITQFPQPSMATILDWPLTPVYLGKLSPEQLATLIQSDLIEVDDSEELEEALAGLERQLSGKVNFLPRQTIKYLRWHGPNVYHSTDQVFITELGLDDRRSYSHKQVRAAYQRRLQEATTGENEVTLVDNTTIYVIIMVGRTTLT